MELVAAGYLDWRAKQTSLVHSLGSTSDARPTEIYDQLSIAENSTSE